MQNLEKEQIKLQIQQAEKTIQITKENIEKVKNNLEVLKEDERNLHIYETAKKQIEEAEANFLLQVAKIEELKRIILDDDDISSES